MSGKRSILSSVRNMFSEANSSQKPYDIQKRATYRSRFWNRSTAIKLLPVAAFSAAFWEANKIRKNQVFANLDIAPTSDYLNPIYDNGESIKERRRRKRAMHHDQQPPARSPWKIPVVLLFYQFLPLRALSRAWGYLNNIYLPVYLRIPVLQMYVWLCQCDLSEAEVPDLMQYKNLGDFFRRSLRPGLRPIDFNAALTSPADGKVIHFGKVDADQIEQVKGLTYSIAAFLGPQSWKKKVVREENVNYCQEILQNKDTALYHCVIYLAPGDYHRFHSPTDWDVFYRRHFPGYLFSVSPRICRLIEGLFNYNERVAYVGKWRHGFFSTVAVGATNVGSIKVHFDPLLQTNGGAVPNGSYEDSSYFLKDDVEKSVVKLKAGEEFGEFNLGSTMVMLFEAPKDFEFQIDVNQKIKYGEAIGSFPKEEDID